MSERKLFDKEAFLILLQNVELYDSRDKEIIEELVNKMHVAIDIKATIQAVYICWGKNTTKYVPEKLCKQKWISVLDQLPTKEDGKNSNGAVIAIERHEGYAKRWDWGIVADYADEFLCWMPFPDPPKDGEQK